MGYPLRRRPGSGRLLGVLALAALAAVTLDGCALATQAPRVPSPADSLIARTQLDRVVLRYWRSVVPRRPDLAAALGWPVDSLPSPRGGLDDAQARQLARMLGTELEGIDPDALSPRDYATMQTLRWELEAAAEASTYGVIDFSILSPEHSPLASALRVLQGHAFVATGDLDRYLYLLEGISYWLVGAREVIEERERHGAIASADAVRSFTMFTRELRRLAAGDAWRVSDARLARIDTGYVREFRKWESEALSLRLQPALDSTISWLQDYGARALPQPGLWQYPGGKEYYRHLLRRSLGMEIEPEEAQRAGLLELQRLDSLVTRMRQRWGWSSSVPALHDSLRRSPRLSPISLDSAMSRVRDLQVTVRDSVAARVEAVPASDPLIRAASAFEVLLFPGGRARAPEFVDSVAQLVMTPWWTSPEALFEGRSLAFRWNWPGSVLAATMSYSVDSLSPTLLLHPSGAWVSGWAEYAASLAGEFGMYGDPNDAYGRLMHEGWNAALLVADVGTHYHGWTRPQAMAVLRPWSIASDDELDSVYVARVVQSPGRSGAATIGAREFAAMRAWMQRLLGPDFDPRAWHRELLTLGPVPLPVLANYLEWWSWSKRVGSKP